VSRIDKPDSDYWIYLGNLFSLQSIEKGGIPESYKLKTSDLYHKATGSDSDRAGNPYRICSKNVLSPYLPGSQVFLTTVVLVGPSVFIGVIFQQGSVDISSQLELFLWVLVCSYVSQRYGSLLVISNIHTYLACCIQKATNNLHKL